MSVDAVIVDKDAAALRELCGYLSAYKEVLSITGTALSGPEAVSTIDRLNPGVVFSDIHLGEMTAFDVMGAITHSPLVVLTSVCDSCAVKAFEYAVLDYLLKPIDPERLTLTLKRLTKKRSLPEDVKTSGKSCEPSSTISSRIGLNTYHLAVSDVDLFEAQGYYAAAWVGNRQYPVRVSLRELETRLAQRGFVRIHRKYIVNTARVDSTRISDAGSASVRLTSPEQRRLPVSRRRLPFFRNVLTADSV